MLRELSVQNLALIEDARVELQAGYCAWTGETGAGKSLLLTALSLVLGGKASTDLVRAGKPEARAAAVFDVSDPTLRADIEALLGGPPDDDTLVLTRRIAAPGQGRSSAQVNGLPVPVATLQALGARLLDVHGQNEGRALADPDRQREMLDAQGKLAPFVETYQARRDAYDALRRRRLALVRVADQRAREAALLEFERDELLAAAPVVGEPAALTAEAHRLGRSGQIRDAASHGYETLYEADRSAQELLCRAAKRLAPLADVMPALGEAAETLERLAEETREVACLLRDLAREGDEPPSTLDAIEARLAVYRRLSGRFRCDPDDLAARLETTQARLETLGRDESDLAALDAPLAAAWASLKTAAASLTAARCKAGKAFARAVQARLKPLGLESARLDVEVTPAGLVDDFDLPPPPASGADRVEIVFSANPGEVSRPLAKVASGGELSRLTLAVKTVLAGIDGVPTLVFDEIDTGVGGRLGAVLGKTLAELARHHQVICVTHLPQMASFAASQWVVRKHVDQGRTRTTITPLDHTERVAELAAMLRGDSAAESTRHEAVAMLREAGTFR